MLEYTICFIRRGDEMLMLNRDRNVWMGRWNGVGGRLQPGESPTQCALREVAEETGILLDSVLYKGIVTWTVDGEPRGGMYAFVADVGSDFTYETPIGTREGILDWKATKWIMHPDNMGVAANVPMVPTQDVRGR